MPTLRPLTETELEFEVNVKNNYVDCVDLPNGRTRRPLPLPSGGESAGTAGTYHDRPPARLPEPR
ncbi:hypothetical protein GCM10027280_47990 [Micromonospora polyrhachis]|uniref:Uncharacterized protein n=1 Tax=Micromonospora polyrhachis TaxID=1282883 RepID=A0A7W7STN4_9ACTN|nr:hypothetical protein [Micromonospora polyrhachis]MBB4960651.1 hypothetical protein [Micromonospora polyrhachis]